MGQGRLIFVAGLVAIAALLLHVFLVQREALKRKAAAATRTQSKPPDRPIKRADDWSLDIELEAVASDVSCQFPVYLPHGSSDSSVFDSKGNVVGVSKILSAPVILRGFMESWPAMKNSSWSRPRFLGKYGKKAVTFDSAVMMCYRDRVSEEKFVSVQKALASLRQGEVDEQDLIIHDVSAANSIPELREDFEVPSVFQQQINDKAEQEGKAWHLLSIGASKSGLPFHSHGSLYLGLVHGLKRWFVYPPGLSAPEVVLRASHPLQSVFEWFTNLYPMFDALELDYAPLHEADRVHARKSTDKSSGFRPLECIQRPGDIVYIPEGWLHQTLNIGETVAIGAQMLFATATRYDFFTDLLKKTPDNFDALRHAGISAAFSAMEEESRVKYSISAASADGMVRLNPQSRSLDFHNLVLLSEDTWFVQYFLQGDDASRASAILWNRVASPLKGILSVGAVEVPSLHVHPEEHAFVVQRHNLSRFMDSNGKFSQQIVRIFLGNRHSTGAAVSMDEVIATAIDFDVTAYTQSDSGSEKGRAIKAQVFVDYALGVLANGPAGLGVGSSVDICAKSKRLYMESRSFLEKSLALQPLHPEVRGFLPDMLAHAGLKDAMHEVMNETLRLFDPLAGIALAADFNRNLPARPSKRDPKVPRDIPTTVLAPLYHVMAEVLLAHNLGKDALGLLQKALVLNRLYGPALVDTIAAYIQLKDRENTEEAMDAAVKSGVMTKFHPKLRQFREYLDALDDMKEQERIKQGGNEREPSKVRILPRHGQPQSPPKFVRSSTPPDDSNPIARERRQPQKGQRRGRDRASTEEFGQEN